MGTGTVIGFIKALSGAAALVPVRGVDYWTEEDVAQIRGYVTDSILNGRW